MNEFSQTSLKGQGLLLLEQGIARVCSIGELVLQTNVFSSSFQNTLSFALLDHWSPASLLSWSAHVVRSRPTFLLPSLGSHMVSLCVHLLLSILATWPLHFQLSLSARLEASLMPVLLLKCSHRIRSRSVTWVILRSIFFGILGSFVLVCVIVTKIGSHTVE